MIEFKVGDLVELDMNFSDNLIEYDSWTKALKKIKFPAKIKSIDGTSLSFENCSKNFNRFRFKLYKPTKKLKLKDFLEKQIT